MAVFTALPRAAIGRYMQEFGQGGVVVTHGTVLGSENSNFYVHTLARRLVATVFEADVRAALSFSACLAYALCINGLPTPAPCCSSSAPLCSTMDGRLILACANLMGSVGLQASHAAAARAASALALLHVTGMRCEYYCPHMHGATWVRASVRLAASHAPHDGAHALEHEASLLVRLVLSMGHARLPRGLCHYDLFQDNVAFATPVRTARERLSGCFDFHFAGCGRMVMDAAILAVAWCTRGGHAARAGDASAALHAYQALRPLSRRERAAMHGALRAAALRFWASRLCGYYRHRVAGLRCLHEPRAFNPACRGWAIHTASVQPWVLKTTCAASGR
ncbi:Homoserine kinase [Candidatus Tremblaya princeps]|uniref:Homoserine kinase n=1 Tax=Tremblaya princeps TaxID=189385 RepID=A0A143WNG6_TREPR|nr:Homoserine kinase [Candidatus Tremblaya princeps]